MSYDGKTFALIGGGPSLTQEDVDAVRGHARVIAINDAYRLAPWADVLYAADAKWIDWHGGVPSFAGPKYSIEGGHVQATTRPDWTVLRNTGLLGLETDPSGLRAGFNSGFQALNLAYHLGATRVLLLGYDMKVGVDGRDHWFGSHPDGILSPYLQMIAAFDSLVEPLKDAGVEVINCTPDSALKFFPNAHIHDALSMAVGR